ncbi:ATP-dependent DNA ligase [Chitinophaga sp. SYP-B3965]|uniref:ATP-dependent DNA ligase n=1 Tax=Chitinophaga sp. SYP-B3965 TaxID=2663120 RepID=UPI0012999B5A|nr:ATP-dependent DNA ligase [Chitinophaga sp. SYP-B3965]MRG47417.1 ATP-dependent DNA ligase [Chitinophaga sp. SYP-B3965]
MQHFSQLISTLAQSTKTNEKLEALSRYFTTADEKDKPWVLALFSGRRPKRVLNSAQMRQWSMELTGLPEWLFNECYHTVGDLAETIALLLPPPETKAGSHPLHYWLDGLLRLDKASEEEKSAFVRNAWDQMEYRERFVFNKLITGGFRIGVSQSTIVNALAKAYNIVPATVSHLISGNWDPQQITMTALLNEESSTIDDSKPYPFFLAYALEGGPQTLGDPEEWQAEWKWDGIRGQVIRRNGQLFIWSRGEELITEKFPEITALLPHLPDGVAIDGEILAYDLAAGRPLPFQALQTRIGRKNLTKKQLQEAPVIFHSYDLLEYDKQDLRLLPLQDRRTLLEKLVNKADQPALKLSPAIPFTKWEELTALREESRNNGSEGLMLKKLNSVYQTGRRRGDWWKWKIDPYTVDAVMIYAQKGHGRRSNLYTDYTFAVKNGDQLVPFAKAYSGLTDKEIAEVDNWVKRNSLEKFGPVRTVKPELVFEIAFEGIGLSSRHKSGIAIRFPRIHRWRKDKPVAEINTLDDLKKLL